MFAGQHRYSVFFITLGMELQLCTVSDVYVTLCLTWCQHVPRTPSGFSPLSQYLLSKLSKAWWHDRPGNMVIMFLIAVTHVSLLSNQQCKLIFVVFVAMSQCLHFTGTFCLEYQFSWACVEQYLSIELS